jgi:hypothetical protein
MDETKFRAVVEATVRRYVEYTGKEDPTPALISEIVEAASDWANERYCDGRAQGMTDEREVHFG